MLPPNDPVWIVESQFNDPVVQRLWSEAERPEDYLHGITTFQPSSDGSAESDFLGMIETIHKHHGQYAADPPYSLLEVIGCSSSEPVRAALAELGFRVTSFTSEGFSATNVA